MTKSGQTSNYTAKLFLEDIHQYAGVTPHFVIAQSGEIPKNIVDWYNQYNEVPVQNDLNGSYTGSVLEKDLIDRSTTKQNKSDKVTRSILRHDTKKLTDVIASILAQ